MDRWMRIWNKWTMIHTGPQGGTDLDRICVWRQQPVNREVPWWPLVPQRGAGVKGGKVHRLHLKSAPGLHTWGYLAPFCLLASRKSLQHLANYSTGPRRNTYVDESWYFTSQKHRNIIPPTDYSHLSGSSLRETHESWATSYYKLIWLTLF